MGMMRLLMLDLLKIRYLFVLEGGAMDLTSPFQGFSRALSDLHWAMRLICELPADVLEPSHPLDGVIAQRMGGERQLVWVPVDISALEPESSDIFGAFIVCFTGDKKTAARTQNWIDKQAGPILHVKCTSEADAKRLASFGSGDIREYCRAAFEHHKAAFSEPQRDAVAAALEAWTEPALIPTDHPRLGHNIFLANQMTLRRAGQDAWPEEAWTGDSEANYSARIAESVTAALQLRDEVGLQNFHRMLLPTPGLILSEPALYRHSYKPVRAEGPFKDKLARKTLRMLQTQRGLFNGTTPEFLDGFQNSGAAQALMQERASELLTFTLGVGIRAASTSAAVMRLSPGVNHVFPRLDSYARHIRSPKMEARLKSKRLFVGIQEAMARALGDERLDVLRSHQGPIKLVSDCPLEWLDVGGLPLALARNCSRINATPGNVSMIQLAKTQAVNVPPSAFDRPLVVCSFAENDPLRNIMRDSLQAFRASDGSVINHEFQRVGSVDEFVDVLNAYDGAVLIFDGHGAANTIDPIGGIMIGTEKVDVWQLRYKVRVPPIVILSACDTQSLDARSHATVANGFLALGATTVLGTLLPVGGQAGALFAARLVYRLKEFLPAALSSGWRVLNWTEVISGMLRMTLISELLDALVGPHQSDLRREQRFYNLQVQSSQWINSGEDDWYDLFLKALAEELGLEAETLRQRALNVIARSEAIRYIQLGNPEMIRIADHHIEEALDLPV